MVLGGLSLLLSGGAAGQDPVRSASFEADIYPIFESTCNDCHGPKVQRAQLRLDGRELAFAQRPDGAVILPGNPLESSLYQRVAGLNGLERMPFGGQLEPAQVELIRTWIEQGAVWPDGVGSSDTEISRHWAFVAPVRPGLPEVSRNDWPANPIDRFILERLETEGLLPSPEADRVTLRRRLSLDLIGLPPSIEEVDAFDTDPSPDAYREHVEKLLSSPHYGERWGRHWLDVARYADSDGFEKDKSRRVWFYRDWVIQALNSDLPYDRFIIEQLAGDLLPEATQDQIVATGFLRNSMINEEGGIDPEQFRMEAMFDRMDAIGKGILGVTIQCAQCHDHKFDPLRQEDYYRMFAFLNNSHEANVPVYTPEEQMKKAEIFGQIREIEAGLKHRHPDWDQRLARWEADVYGDQPAWTVLRPEINDISTGGQKYSVQEDGSLLAGGFSPSNLALKLTVGTEVQDITAFRLELLTDPNLPLGGPGRSLKGMGALTEFEVQAAPAGDPEKSSKIKLVRAEASLSVPERLLEPTFDDKTGRRRVTGPAEFAIDGKKETAWGIDNGPGRRNQPRQAVFVAEAPISHPQGTLLTFQLLQVHGGWNSDDNQSHNLGRFRLSLTTSPDAGADPVPARIRSILELPPRRRTALQQQLVFGYWRTTVPEWQSANDRIEDLWQQHPEGSAQLVLQERESERDTHVLMRGDFLKPEKSVAAGVPSFLHPFPEGLAENRLGFARWLVDRQSPTTARSLVNRVWQTYFGTGLVATSEDLGTQSEAASHPQLLDWLAVEFMDQGWSLKKLHRLILNSATYRQTSRMTPTLLERDPYNRLLARGPRLRVEAEIVRDITLAASGLLNPRIGGPSVFPPAPTFLFKPPASFGPKIWDVAEGEDRYRRALYTFRYRSVPYPMLQTFDAPNGDTSCVRRSRSNTPLQALTALNEPLFMEAAQALALKTLKEGGPSDLERVTFAFRRCLARRPEAEEIRELLSLLQKQTVRLAQGWISPWGIAGIDEKRKPELPEGTTPVQLAAWTTVSRLLLNLDETITKE